LEQVRAIHSHGGKTEILVHEVAPLPKRKTESASKRFEILMQIIDEASRLTVVSDDEDRLEIRSKLSTDKLRALVDILEKDSSKIGKWSA
jgi:hypothetical protein